MIKMGLVAVLALLLVVPLLAGCAPEKAAPPESPSGPATPQEPQETKVIKIADITDLSGPAALQDTCAYEGRVDYTTWFNAQNFIPGVEIELLWRDTATDIARCVPAYREVAEAGVVAVSTGNSAILNAVYPLSKKDGIPHFGITPAEPQCMDKDGNYFFHTCLYPDMFGGWLDYMMDNWNETRAPRLGFVLLDTGMGWDLWNNPKIQEYCDDKGVEIVGHEAIPYVCTDFSIEITRLAGANADWIYVQGMSTQAAPALNDAGMLGFLSDMQFGGGYVTCDKTLIQLAGENAEGFIWSHTYPNWDETNILGVKTSHELQLERAGNEDEPKSLISYWGGWMDEVAKCAAIKKAYEDDGWPVTPEAIYKAAVGLKNINALDVTPPISFSETEHRGTMSVRIDKVQGGKIVPVTDWLTAPDLCRKGLEL